jgi:colanic acid/amylovoran biosynthesis glycosyltransferase
VGRPHWKKGYDYALKACAKLDQQGIDFKYTIIGAAGDEELLFLIDDLGLQDHVTLTDKLPQAKVFELMQKSDLLLLPSLEEGIANVAVEAMALGCPVISTDCGGMQELITHDEEGWIVTARDLEAMSNQIFEFSQMDVDEVSRIKKQARLKVEEQHGEKKMVSNMNLLYQKVCNNLF